VFSVANVLPCKKKGIPFTFRQSVRSPDAVPAFQARPAGDSPA
jgi:hypothetical protein